jgi:hypothetical protein
MNFYEDTLYEEMVDDNYSDLAGDFTVNDKKARNKRSNTNCYSSKHVRQSIALNKPNKGKVNSKISSKK